jgi:hypothetical protein
LPPATEKNEVVIAMKFSCLSKIVTIAGCLAACLPAAVAQNTITLLSDSPIEPAPNTVSPTNPYVFQSTIQELNCVATPIYAILSSAPSALNHSNEGLLVLDSVQVTVTPPQGSATGPVNVCPNQFNPPGAVCFNPATVGTHGNLNQFQGQDPDNNVAGTSPVQTYFQVYGVPAIQIGSMLSPGMQSVTIQLENTLPPAQGSMGNSTLYLNTNCTSSGVSGPATVVNGTPPTGGTPETFTFDSGTGQGINFQYTIPAGVGNLSTLTEHVSDTPIDPSAFDSNYTYGTSFSVSSCYLHAGELLGNGNPACKMFTLLCSQGTDPTESGAICPASAAADEIFGESFDPPASFALTLPDIATPSGTYHTGVGLLMGPDTWTPGEPCQYTPGSIAAEQDLICPENLLFNFFGPGSSSSQGRGDNVNSTFITIYGVPEPLTTVTMTDQNGNPVGVGPANGNWTNNPNPYVQLSTTPPIGVSQTALPGASEFVAAPIQNISYGLTAPGGTVPQPASEPIATDTTLAAPTCPTVGYNGTPPATAFTAAPQQLALSSGDGSYTLHYYGQDCAGTQELQFALNSLVVPPSWYTAFYTYPINLDTVAPTIAGLTLSPAGGSYTYGQPVTASFSCSDSESGLEACGGTTYTLSNGTGPSASGTLSLPVPTSALGGTNTFTVTATDFAGNTSSASVTYTVTQAPQTITGFSLPSQLAYAPPMTPIPLNAAGGGSGNPVTFTVHAGPGTISCTPNCALTITGLGTVTVYANQAGNANYLAAPQVAQSVVVSTYLAPVISGVGASSVSNTSETLSATINPENASTAYYFSYGLNPGSLTSVTAPKVLAAGVTGDPVSATIVGLQANMTYYYRVTAKSNGGQVVSSTLSFTTP